MVNENSICNPLRKDVKRSGWVNRISTKLILKKLKKTPRYTPNFIKIEGLNLSYPDSASFVSMYKSIFVKKMYSFRSDKESPLIIDCGANIGLSVIFFKQQFPSSTILAFEPDPYIFKHLQHNLHVNRIEGVSLINKAAWISETTLDFYTEKADGSRIAMEGETNIIKVPAVRLRDFLNREVDFLKIDIEGAEDKVMPDIADSLSHVLNLFVEYHSFSRKEQKLPEILHLIKAKGFRIHILPEIVSDRPFCEVKEYAKMDMQLNIFCWREEL